MIEKGRKKDVVRDNKVVEEYMGKEFENDKD